MLKPFNEAEHGHGLGRLRHLPQPSEPAQVAALSVFGQAVEAFALFGGKPGGQASIGFPARAMTQIGTKPFQRCRRRHDNRPLATRLHHQFGQKREAVILDRSCEQHIGQLCTGAPPERTKSELLLAQDRMPLSTAVRREILVDAARKHVDLRRHERQQGRRRPLASAERASGKAQVAEHQCISQTVLIAAATPDCHKIRVGERVVPDQFTLRRRRLEQRRDLGFVQLLPSRHVSLQPL